MVCVWWEIVRDLVVLGLDMVFWDYPPHQGGWVLRAAAWVFVLVMAVRLVHSVRLFRWFRGGMRDHCGILPTRHARPVALVYHHGCPLSAAPGRSPATHPRGGRASPKTQKRPPHRHGAGVISLLAKYVLVNICCQLCVLDDVRVTVEYTAQAHDCAPVLRLGFLDTLTE